MSERLTLEIPAHLQPALDRRGKEWLIEQLQAAAADDIAHTLRGYLAAKEREKHEYDDRD